jgi:hypothetical protein
LLNYFSLTVEFKHTLNIYLKDKFTVQPIFNRFEWKTVKSFKYMFGMYLNSSLREKYFNKIFENYKITVLEENYLKLNKR